MPAAFHVHSPGSHDWGREPHADREANERQRLLTDAGRDEFLDKLAPHLRIVAITDHMKTEYACRLAARAKARGDVAIFPGIEINCVGGQLGSSRFHLLALFPPENDVTAIDRIFASHGGFPSEPNRNGQEDFQIGTSLSQWAESVRRQRGIVVLAHVDEAQRGHRARFRATREGSLGYERTSIGSDAPLEVQQQVSQEYLGYIAELAPDAIEIMNPQDRQHYVSFSTSDGNSHRLPCVIRSDHHCVEDFARDECVTWLKVARPDFASVEDALRFFETRVRFKDDLPETPSPRIVGIRLRSPGKSGLFEDAIVAFNPNLNCIIGPRGSGKSTIIEAIRYVLGRNAALAALQRGGDGQVDFSDVALNIQRANLVDTLIELIYEDEQGTRSCLTATYDPQSTETTSVYLLDGTKRPMGVAGLAAEFPLRLYSWSEIETLGREIERQRTLLDRLIPELAPLIERRTQLLADLAANRHEVEAACDELHRLLNADNGLLRRYAQYKADFELVNTEDVAVLFADFDLARERIAALAKARESLDNVRDALSTASGREFADSETWLAAHSDRVRQWWQQEIAESLALGELAQDVRDLMGQAIAKLDEKISMLGELTQREEQRRAETETSLRERTQADAAEGVLRDQREERRARYQRASARRDEYARAHDRLTTLLAERKRSVADLDATRQQISKMRADSRETLLASLAPADMDIGIALEAGGDRDAAVAYMRDTGFLTRDRFGHYKERRIAERCSSMAGPTLIAQAILDNEAGRLESEGTRFGSEGALDEGEAKQLVEHFHPFARDEDADVEVVSSQALLSVLKLEELPMDDLMSITLEGRTVDQLSPGQRSSAMLPLVALSETAPLVIDQPEDNLDNRMVGRTLTKILADLKERRQIIVTTHNPNIVVGGDAEQVVVVESTSARDARVEETGSIDDPQIVENVVSIMEGGREAFETRNRRYARRSA